MDPNETLAQIRRAVAIILKGDGTHQHLALLGEELAEAFDDLDGWLSRQGFVPEGWGPR